MSSSRRVQRVLVTGASGFLGGHVCEFLRAKKEFDVFPVGLNNTHESPDFTVSDITDPQEVERLFESKRPDHVVHLAALTGVQKCKLNPFLAFRVNVLGTFNVAWGAAQRRGHVVFASSREVYGDTLQKASEESPLNPRNLYALTKALGESTITGLGSTSGLRYHILRITNIYGPGGRKDVVTDFIQMTSGGSISFFGGDQTINLIDVRDVARAIYLCLKDPKGSATLNIGSKDTVLVRELANLVAQSSGKQVKIVRQSANDDTQHFVPDLSKAETYLGFEAQHGLRETILELLPVDR